MAKRSHNTPVQALQWSGARANALHAVAIGLALVVVLTCTLLTLMTSKARAQQGEAKRVVVLYWYNKDYPWNVKFDQRFQGTLHSASPGIIEYYPEYLESDRFPGEGQALLLHEYLKQKYAGRKVDVVVANSDASLDFLLKYRSDLFPQSPIVFVATRRPTNEEVEGGPGITGVVNLSGYRNTLDLALKLHPGTAQVYAISGTLDHDKRFETLAREQLGEFENRVQITYLTDLPLGELIDKVKSLPEHSVVLYIWQQSRNSEGRVLETTDVLASIAPVANVPLYGMSLPLIGIGVVGGYVNAAEEIGSRSAEIALQIAKGTRAQDIPIDKAPSVPMFDWRQLQRWGLSEDALPPNSIVRFKEETFWHQYKLHIIGGVTVILLEAALIAGLLIERKRRWRVTRVLAESEKRFRNMADTAPVLIWMSGPDKLANYFNRAWLEFTGRTFDQELANGWIEGVHPDDRDRCFNTYMTAFEARESFRMEYKLRRFDGEYRRVLDTGVPRFTLDGVFKGYIGSGIDITEFRRAEEELQRMTGRLIHLQDEEHRRVAAELHDGLGQTLSIIRNRAMLCKEEISDRESVLEQLDEVLAAAVSAIDEVREIAHNLRPYELDRLGLVSAVDSMLGRVSDATSIHLCSDLDKIDGLLSPSEETSIYRIVQEGLNNVVRHAEATEARVAIKRTDSEIIVFVQDNGKGFRPKTLDNGGNASGFGLHGIAERARMLGGVYSLETQPGHGTRLTVRLRLNDQRNGEKSSRSYRR